MDECGECADGKPYESAEDRSDREPYGCLGVGVVKSWLIAMISRPASITSYGACDCREELLL